MDFGYRAPAVVLWAILSPDGVLRIVDERVATEVTLEIKRGERWSQDLRLPLGQSDSHQEV